MSDEEVPTRQIAGAAIRVFGETREWDATREQVKEQAAELEQVLEGAFDRAMSKASQKFKESIAAILDDFERSVEAVAFLTSPDGEQLQPSPREAPRRSTEIPPPPQREGVPQTVQLDAEAKRLLQNIRDEISSLAGMLALK
jgi:hypothetical protein